MVVVAGIWTAGISSSPEAPTSALVLARRGREELTQEELREEKRDTEGGRQTHSFGARVEGVEIAWSLCVFQKKKKLLQGEYLREQDGAEDVVGESSSFAVAAVVVRGLERQSDIEFVCVCVCVCGRARRARSIRRIRVSKGGGEGKVGGLVQDVHHADVE